MCPEGPSTENLSTWPKAYESFPILKPRFRIILVLGPVKSVFYRLQSRHNLPSPDQRLIRCLKAVCAQAGLAGRSRQLRGTSHRACRPPKCKNLNRLLKPLLPRTRTSASKRRGFARSWLEVVSLCYACIMSPPPAVVPCEQLQTPLQKPPGEPPNALDACLLRTSTILVEACYGSLPQPLTFRS